MTPAEPYDPLQTTHEVAAPDELPSASRDPNTSPAPPTVAAFPPVDPQATGPYHAAAQDGTPATPPARTAPIPTVPVFELLGVLGRGGVGVVYMSWYLAQKRVVAIKMILGAGHAAEKEQQSFRFEAE